MHWQIFLSALYLEMCDTSYVEFIQTESIMMYFFLCLYQKVLNYINNALANLSAFLVRDTWYFNFISGVKTDSILFFFFSIFYCLLMWEGSIRCKKKRLSRNMPCSIGKYSGDVYIFSMKREKAREIQTQGQSQILSVVIAT